MANLDEDIDASKDIIAILRRFANRNLSRVSRLDNRYLFCKRTNPPSGEKGSLKKKQRS